MYFFCKNIYKFYTLCRSGSIVYECFAELCELASLVTLSAASDCAFTLDCTHSCEAGHSSPILDFIKAL